MFTLLFEVTNTNLLFGLPESLGMLLFGSGMIVSAVSLRRILNRNETTRENLKQMLAKSSQ